MVERNPEDKCLLCQQSKATQKGSHLIPASLVASMVGKRYYEQSHSIMPNSDKPIDTAYGRSNLKNANTEQRQIQFVKDFIYCPECEKKLAVLESEINPVLTLKIKDTNQKQNFPESKLASGFPFVTCSRVNPEIFKLYILSLIWRLNDLYYLNTGKPFLKDEDSEWIRLRLTESMGMSLNEISQKCNSKLLEEMPFAICGCVEDLPTDIDREDGFANLSVPHPHYIQPYCFLFNNYMVVFGFTNKQLESSEEIIHLKDFNVNKRLLNVSGPIKVGIVSPENWKNFTIYLWRVVAYEFKYLRAEELSKKNGQTIDECNELIMEKAKEISQATGNGFGECYDEAFKVLMAKD